MEGFTYVLHIVQCTFGVVGNWLKKHPKHSTLFPFQQCLVPKVLPFSKSFKGQYGEKNSSLQASSKSLAHWSHPCGPFSATSKVSKALSLPTLLFSLSSIHQCLQRGVTRPDVKWNTSVFWQCFWMAFWVFQTLPINYLFQKPAVASVTRIYEKHKLGLPNRQLHLYHNSTFCFCFYYFSLYQSICHPACYFCLCVEYFHPRGITCQLDLYSGFFYNGTLSVSLHVCLTHCMSPCIFHPVTSYSL